MSTIYAAVDAAIIDAIRRGANPLYASEVTKVAIAARSSIYGSARTIDRRLQALRKAGRIEHLTVAQAKVANRRQGWNVVETQP